VYISGNPYISEILLEENIGRNPFHNIEEVWDWGWNTRLETVPPERVTEAALDANIPSGKRMIIHYMQPHLPFLPTNYGDYLSETDSNQNAVQITQENYGLGTVEDLIGSDMSKEEFWEKYKFNLKAVLQEVDRLIGELDGKIVITADHGEAVGEYSIYTHPVGIRIEELVKVPKKVVRN
jgi:hypothetical protein